MPSILLPFTSKKRVQSSKGAKAGHTPTHPVRGSGPRIPNALRAVFVASNSAKNEEDIEAILPPPASKNHVFPLRNVVSSLRMPMLTTRARKSLREVPSSSRSVTSADTSFTTLHTTDSMSPKSSLPKPVVHVHYGCVPEGIEGLDGDDDDVTLATNFTFEPAITSTTIPPQQYLDIMLSSRGYSTERYDTLQTAYWNQPTELQLASYDTYLINLVRKRDFNNLRSLVGCGISLNPCNAHGESLIHTICRLGDAELLLLWLVSGASLQASDDCGRTPLHDACWTVHPRFEVIELILSIDRSLLFMKDSRGGTPLQYIRKENYNAWMDFLISKRDMFWPMRQACVGTEAPPALTKLPPNARPIPNPHNALLPRLARLVASGKLTVAEVNLIKGNVVTEQGGGVVLDEDEEDEDSNGEESTQAPFEKAGSSVRSHGHGGEYQSWHDESDFDNDFDSDDDEFSDSDSYEEEDEDGDLDDLEFLATHHKAAASLQTQNQSFVSTKLII